MSVTPIFHRTGNFWTVDAGNYELSVDGATGCMKKFRDRRDPKGVSLIDGKRLFASFAYTLRQDDVKRGKKPMFTPYADREATFPDGTRPAGSGLECRNEKLGVSLRYEFREDSVRLELSSDGTEFSEFGLNLPFQFLGKKGTSFRHQLLPSTPYVSCDGRRRYWYFSKPDGHPLLLVWLTEADGWKLDYSPYSWGHFVENLKALESFDRAYGRQPRKFHRLAVAIRFPGSFPEALEQTCGEYRCPAAYADISGGKAGEKLAVRVTGTCDTVRVRKPDGTEEVLRGLLRTKQGEAFVKIPLSCYGIYAVIPCSHEKRGLDCRVFAYDDLLGMFRRNCLAIRRPFHIDENLCEGGVWAEALCRNMRLMGKEESLDRLVREQLGRVMPEPGAPRIARCSIPPCPADGYPAYHVYHSMRIQEQFFGVSFLIQAYRLYGEKRYLEYAVSAMASLLRSHLKKNGEIVRQKRFPSMTGEDYTTVTAPVIAVVDLAQTLKADGDSRFRFFEDAAVKIADYLVRRGFRFPTEGTQNSHTEKEMEDGSISCTALSVLYVFCYVSRKREYLRFAKKVLDLHDAWIMRTPDARLNHSTLRWWETIWEGDADGPAICGGHAWTLWRGEADYCYAMITGDAGKLADSFNAFLTNLAKIAPNGESRSCFQPDEITGGGQTSDCGEVPFRLAGGFPKKSDQSLSKYLWVRMENTWLKTAALLCRDGAESAINGRLSRCAEGRRFEPDLPAISRLFLEALPGTLLVCSETTIHIISKQNLSIEERFNPIHDGINWYATPQEGGILLRIAAEATPAKPENNRRQ